MATALRSRAAWAVVGAITFLFGIGDADLHAQTAADEAYTRAYEQALAAQAAKDPRSANLRSEEARAIAVQREALALLDSTALYPRALALTGLGRAQFAARKYKDALVSFETADSLNRLAQQAIPLAIELTELRADCHLAMGRSAKGYAVLKQIPGLQDTLHARQLHTAYAQQEAYYNRQLQLKDLERLEAVGNEKAEVLRLQEERIKWSMVLAALVLLVLLLLVRDRRRARRYALERTRLARPEPDARAPAPAPVAWRSEPMPPPPAFVPGNIAAIAKLLRKGDGLAALAYLDALARLLRMLAEHGERATVNMQEELDLLRQYLKVEAMRFGGGLKYTVDTDRALLDAEVRIPALLVQPFVERAIAYGLAEGSNDRQVHVRLYMHNTALMCSVELMGNAEQEAVGRQPSRVIGAGEDRSAAVAGEVGAASARYEHLLDATGNVRGTRVVLRVK